MKHPISVTPLHHGILDLQYDPIRRQPDPTILPSVYVYPEGTLQAVVFFAYKAEQTHAINRVILDADGYVHELDLVWRDARERLPDEVLGLGAYPLGKEDAPLIARIASAREVRLVLLGGGRTQTRVLSAVEQEGLRVMFAMYVGLSDGSLVLDEWM